MISGHPLRQLFGSAQASVLEVLLEIDDHLSIRQIARLADVSPPTAAKALEALERRHVVVREARRAAQYFRLSKGLAYEELLRKILSDARAIDIEFGGRVVEMLSPIAPTGVILYGSAARNSDSVESDVDVLVTTERGVDVEPYREHVIDVERRLSEWIGREVHLVVVDPPTVTERRQTFWREVIRDGRLLAGKMVG